ncbi:MAG: ferritin family protein [Bacteroidales bacterium]
MREDVKKELLKAQQSELETVVIYKYLAAVAKDEEMKAVFQKMATEEGRHAGILRKYTGETLQRKDKPRFMFRLMTKVLGIRYTMKMMVMTEMKTAEAYAPMAASVPLMKDVVNDEKRHRKHLQRFIDEKRK